VTKQRLIAWLGPIVSEYYAATEGLGTFVDSATWLAHPGTVGKPFVEDMVMVATRTAPPFVRRDGVGVPQGADGSASSTSTTPTRRRHLPGGVLHPGDIGHFDAEGYLYLTDRSANLIISGGVNIYPAEVDAVLLEHPAVGDVGTIGVPDPEWGEAVKTVVELQPGVQPSPELAEELMATAESGWPTSSARARSTSSTSYPVRTTASCTGGSCGPATPGLPATDPASR